MEESAMKIKKTPANPIALVTGASKRIGRAIALSLAGSGHGIVVHYNSSKEDAVRLCKEIKEMNVPAWPLRADLGKPMEAEGLIGRAFDQCGPLSVLVNNASIFPAAKVDEVTFKDFTLNMTVNAWAPFCLSRAFQRNVKKGVIVNILDARRTGEDASHVAYSISKHALEGITRLCAMRFAPHIRVNAVAPGLILPPQGKDMSYLEKLKSRVPLRRFGDPQDIADAVVFLVKSRFITGEIVHADGGRRTLGTIG
jgi:NAD(P)-dependent dehydrogenase (short-subunit alcohol dehydrogenase family)